MVVAQLVEWSLLIPEVISLNPVIGKIYFEHLVTVKCIKKTKIKVKEAENGPFKTITTIQSRPHSGQVGKSLVAFFAFCHGLI